MWLISQNTGQTFKETVSKAQEKSGKLKYKYHCLVCKGAVYDLAKAVCGAFREKTAYSMLQGE
jgi:hypothetical protein